MVCEWDMTESCKRCFSPVLKFLRSHITTDTGKLHNECGERDKNKQLYVGNAKVRAISKVKVKVRFTLETATKAQRWSRGIALLFL